jgi:hypothetical protein
MDFLRLVPVILSSLVLGAHFMRAGIGSLVLLSLFMPFLLLVRERWAARVVQCFLVLGALEWVRTTVVLVAERREARQDWTRLVLILGFVTVVTGASALIFQSRSIATRFALRDGQDDQDKQGPQSEADGEAESS